MGRFRRRAAERSTGFSGERRKRRSMRQPAGVVPQHRMNPPRRLCRRFSFRMQRKRQAQKGRRLARILHLQSMKLRANPKGAPVATASELAASKETQQGPRVFVAAGSSRNPAEPPLPVLRAAPPEFMTVIPVASPATTERAVAVLEPPGGASAGSDLRQ